MLWKLSPAAPANVLLTAVVATPVFFLLALIALHGAWTQDIGDMLGEQMAPKSATLVMTISCLILAVRVAIFGPFTTRDTWAYALAAGWLPNLALTFLALICGVTTGSLAAAALLGGDIDPSYPGIALQRWGGLLFALLFVIALTAIRSDAPLFQTRRHAVIMRVLALLFALMLLNLSALALAARGHPTAAAAPPAMHHPTPR